MLAVLASDLKCVVVQAPTVSTPATAVLRTTLPKPPQLPKPLRRLKRRRRLQAPPQVQNPNLRPLPHQLHRKRLKKLLLREARTAAWSSRR